jgi:hypothetical protein
MAGLRWFDYQWLPADDRFIFGDLYVPAAGESQGLRWEVANGADDFRVEQRRLVGRELGIACSGVAFSCEGLTIRSDGHRGLWPITHARVQ